MAQTYLRLAQSSEHDQDDTSRVLEAWAHHLDTEIISQLPDASKWKWVAVHLRRELLRSLRRD